MPANLEEAVALAILNSDRAAAGWPEVESRDRIPNSEGYLRNAQASLATINEAHEIVPREATDFLFGRGPLDGVWFGEDHPKIKGRFWWRSRIRQMIAAGEHK